MQELILSWPFCNQITKELSRLQLLASNNKLSSEDITGGTITLSNIGAIGGKFGSPLLNLPEVAIIAIGRIRKLPRYDDDDETIYPASVTNVSCHFLGYYDLTTLTSRRHIMYVNIDLWLS